MKPDYYHAQVPNVGPDAAASPECKVMCTHVIDALGLSYHEGTAFAYLWRKGKVPDPPIGVGHQGSIGSPAHLAWARICRRVDLQKAITHLQFELDRLEREAQEPG